MQTPLGFPAVSPGEAAFVDGGLIENSLPTLCLFQAKFSHCYINGSIYGHEFNEPQDGFDLMKIKHLRLKHFRLISEIKVGMIHLI